MNIGTRVPSLLVIEHLLCHVPRRIRRELRRCDRFDFVRCDVVAEDRRRRQEVGVARRKSPCRRPRLGSRSLHRNPARESAGAVPSRLLTRTTEYASREYCSEDLLAHDRRVDDREGLLANDIAPGFVVGVPSHRDDAAVRRPRVRAHDRSHRRSHQEIDTRHRKYRSVSRPVPATSPLRSSF